MLVDSEVKVRKGVSVKKGSSLDVFFVDKKYLLDRVVPSVCIGKKYMLDLIVPSICIMR